MKTANLPYLPINECLGDLSQSLANSNNAILIAPPGAGKSTRVPLELCQQEWAHSGKIIMLEPRRIAARSVASFMASLIEEPVGKLIGYRVRMDSKISAQTKIEVVTEGVFTRMVLDDPSLEGIAGIIFDEFHERSLEADLGLALALDVQSGLRDDLRILVMSATMDGAAVSRLMNKPPLFESKGRSFEVELRYQPRDPHLKIEDAMASTVRQIMAEVEGSVLCFLPGQREIVKTAEKLEGRLPANVQIAPLYGALSASEQDLAIKPCLGGQRKVVLATNIAETSLTIDGVNIVIDSGLSRVARFEPATGLTRLKTERASLSSANQRSGRAGRTAPGIAIRLWHEGQNGALPKHDRPEILEANLQSLVLSLASHGVYDPQMLNWLDNPPKPAWGEATKRLKLLGALDENAKLTDTGYKIAKVPLPPNLSVIIQKTNTNAEKKLACEMAMLISERGLGGNDVDLAKRWEIFKAQNSKRAQNAQRSAMRLAKTLDYGLQAKDRDVPIRSIGALMSLAFPDQIAVQRGSAGHYLMSNGRGVVLDETHLLAKEKYLVVVDLQGAAKGARVISAVAITKDDISNNHLKKIETVSAVIFDEKEKKVRAKKTQRLGMLVLKSETETSADQHEITTCLIGGIAKLGIKSLSWNKDLKALRGKLQFLHSQDQQNWPSTEDNDLEKGLEEWLAPFIPSASSVQEISASSLSTALLHRHGLSSLKQLDGMLPSHFKAPSGSNVPIRYEGDEATLAIRVQELYGLSEHPTILNGKTPLVLELLSPAQRPIQKTSDLPGFWSGSWNEVRLEMRGRYPKHPWPEDPANAKPTNKAKPRK